MNLFVTGGRYPSLNELEAIRRRWFAHDQGLVLDEWAYVPIERRVFVEEFLEWARTFRTITSSSSSTGARS